MELLQQNANSIKIYYPNCPIPLIIDIEDYYILKQYGYKPTPSGILTFYMVYVEYTNSSRIRKLYTLAREIMKLDGGIVDHINGNGMDNRKSNLRICSRLQNRYNSRKKSSLEPSSKYKGIIKRVSGKWRARISINYKRIHIGDFNTEKEAALAYDRKARELFGEFARLNFPEITKGLA